MISLDTETTGLDLRHGARPFFVTTCREDSSQEWWEWPVDPLTREVAAPAADVAAIEAVVESGEELVGHNVKFDATALAAVGLDKWPWERTHDTMLLAHILASNQPKDLTSLVVHYLGHDILPLEKALAEAVKRARAVVRRRSFVDDHGEWATAGDDDPGLPSGGGWGADYWLPRAVASAERWPEPRRGCEHRWAAATRSEDVTCSRCGGHSWWVVNEEYSNTDSATTLALCRVMVAEVKARGRWGMYQERRKLLHVTSHLERRGLSINLSIRSDTEAALRRESADFEATCLEVARRYNYDLRFPKGAVNQSLRTFCFDVLGLEHVRNPKAKTDAPSLDAKTAIPHYLMTLPEDTDQGRFVRAMVGKRARDTGLAFLESWDRYSLPLSDGFSRIHATFNPASSDTIRMTCRDPNAQQIGKRTEDAAGVPIAVLREVFGPAPGREWWSLDFANIELRIPAYLSGERDLVDLFERSDEPPFYGSEHLLNFSIVYDDLWEQAVREVGLDRAGPYVKKTYAGSWYKCVKNGDFAVQYQAGDATADKAFRRPGSRRRLRERFARKERVVAQTLEFAERHGYVETMPDRTVDPSRGYPLMTHRTEYGRVKPTLPFAYKVQGTAGWVGNKAAVRCLEQLDEWNRGLPRPEWFMCCYVHDELVFDFPRRAHPLRQPGRSNLGRINRLRALMEQGGQDLLPAVPTTVSVEYHDRSWADGVVVNYRR